MRRILLLLLLFSASVCSSAQGDAPLPNDSLKTGIEVTLEPGKWCGDSMDTPVPEIPVVNPHAPLRPATVIVAGSMVYTYGQLEGYTFYLLREDEVVYSVEVADGDVPIALPPGISGLLMIVFAEGSRCYYADIYL
ncbi:MAG: hypothetical protein IJ196_05050 [Prevotella sp.]|nr:hypothetical protein [Prevotella sp.]